MNLKQLCIPAVAGLVLLVGCNPKPKDPIPVQAPGPIKAANPEQVLDNLRYMAVRKDSKHAAIFSLSGFDQLNTKVGNVAWFHQLAGELGVSLSAEEIASFGLEPLQNAGLLAAGVSKKELTDEKNKVALKQSPKLPAGMEKLDEMRLDMLNPVNDKAHKAEIDLVASKLPALADSGLYRLAKAVPDEVWRHMSLQAVKPNADPAFKDVFLQVVIQDKPIMVLQVTLGPRKDGNMGVVYAYSKVAVATLKKYEKFFLESEQAK
jgi:hypothetical protein